MEPATHLSEEAMNDVLIGLASPESDAHLAVCAECCEQVQGFRSEMQMFNRTSLAWSEAQPMPALRLKPESTKPESRIRRIAFAPAVWALAVIVLLAAGVQGWNHRRGSHQNAVSAPASTPADSEEQIAQDNQLLHSVDIALSEGDEPPIRGYHLSEGPHSSLKVRSELRKQ